MLETFISLLSSFVGGGAAGGVIVALLQHKLRTDADRITSAETEIKKIRDEEIRRLRDVDLLEVKNDLKKHVSADKSQEILSELKHLSGAVSALTDKIGRCLESNAQQEAEIKGLQRFIDGVNDSLSNRIDVLNRKGTKL